MVLLLYRNCRNHYLLQRLSHLDVHLAAQGQRHRCNLLCHLHACLEVGIDERSIGNGELLKMNAQQLSAKVVVELVSEEWSQRSQQF